MAQDGFIVEIEQIKDYQFGVHFTQGALIADEPPPTGTGSGPQPAELLAAAVGNCLMASLLFCQNKSHAPFGMLKARAQGHLGRDAAGRLRVTRIDVTLIAPGATARCLRLFENYCVVTESVRAGIPVHLAVTDEHGQVLHESPPPGSP
ncbi:OsmC family protein [Acidiferrobacter sp.]|uniref:OsmC family protein n=1 Tax=Acidiferrobacter sp. TaxID=1872107 RepID=UPI0026057BF8|nr:OsmC family protein [Acidiferrobacter sp.]